MRTPPKSILSPYTTLFRSLGIKGMGTRRFFVLLPREGKPVAIAHRIELASFDGFRCGARSRPARWEEHTSELQSPVHLVCPLLPEKKDRMAGVGTSRNGRS